jgi:hypothetical protein
VYENVRLPALIIVRVVSDASIGHRLLLFTGVYGVKNVVAWLGYLAYQYVGLAGAEIVVEAATQTTL